MHVVVNPLFLHQLGVRAAFCDLTVMNDKDQIRVHDGGEAMRDGNDRALSGELTDGLLDLLLRANVDGCGGFIQYNNGTVS